MSVNEVVPVLGLVLGLLLLVTIARSLRKAFARPGASGSALMAYSLTTGRGMLLVPVVASVVFSQQISRADGSAGASVGLLGIAALLLQMAAETRWPRQSGAVRVAMLRRPTLRETVRTRYLVGAVLAAGFAVTGFVFCLYVNPSVTTRSQEQILAACPRVTNVVCEQGSFGASVVPGFQTAAPGRGQLLISAAALLLMAIVAAFAVRQVVSRRMLAGVGPALDQRLRRIAAQRVLRAFAAAGLALVSTMVSDLRDAVNSYSTWLIGLPQALGNFLTLVNTVCAVGIFVLYAVGPNGRSLLKMEKTAAARATTAA